MKKLIAVLTTIMLMACDDSEWERWARTHCKQVPVLDQNFTAVTTTSIDAYASGKDAFVCDDGKTYAH